MDYALQVGFPGGAVINNPPANAGYKRALGSIPGSGRSPGVGNGNPLQYSCLENPMDRGAWWATVHGVAESAVTGQLSTRAYTAVGKRFMETLVVEPGGRLSLGSHRVGHD